MRRIFGNVGKRILALAHEFPVARREFVAFRALFPMGGHAVGKFPVAARRNSTAYRAGGRASPRRGK